MRETKDVRVKALEWETDGEVWWVRGNAPRYEVGPQMSWGCKLHFGGSLIGSPTGDWFLSQGAAKAAAQADYERRIRSALPSPEAPQASEMVRELVEVLELAKAYLIEPDPRRSNCAIIRKINTALAAYKRSTTDGQS